MLQLIREGRTDSMQRWHRDTFAAAGVLPRPEPMNPAAGVENGGTEGLSIIPGNVERFPKNELKIPHMGWNTVKHTIDHPLWHNIEDNARFYSVHSYYVKEDDSSVVAGSTNYGIDFTCAIAKDNMFAVQFHPEKSQHDGLQLLENFVNWNS